MESSDPINSDIIFMYKTKVVTNFGILVSIGSSLDNERHKRIALEKLHGSNEIKVKGVCQSENSHKVTIILLFEFP